jgi:ATP-dependent Zn protease
MDQELRGTAYHEAGHAVADYISGRGVAHVTIIPKDNDYYGLCTARDWPSRVLDTWQVEADVVSRLAGPEAEALLPSLSSELDGEDLELAFLDVLLLTDEREEEALALLGRLVVRAKQLVADHWPAVEAVAAALLAEKELSGERAHELIAAAVK